MRKTTLYIMCGRFGQTSDAITKASRLANIDIQYAPSITAFENNYNTDIGNEAVIIFQSDNMVLGDYAVFGFTPIWAKKPMYRFNARIEGSTGKGKSRSKLNEENDPNYTGDIKVGEGGMFGAATKSRRCLVPVSWFFEGPQKEKLSKPFLIKKENDTPFFLAGCFEIWNGNDEHPPMRSFTIYTTAASGLLQKVGHHRSPMILPERHAVDFLNPTFPMKEITKLMHPFDSKDFEAWPVSAEVRKRNRDFSNNSPLLITPIGERLVG